MIIFVEVFSSTGNVIGFEYRHNFSESFQIKGQYLAYKGFYWNFEDTQFTVLNSINGGYRFWIAGIAKVSNNLSMRLKYTHDDKVNDNNRYIRNTSSNERTPTFYYNVQESGTGNNVYFELVMSF